MPKQAFHIRAAAEGDLAQICEIYAHYVLNGLASFEIEAPDLTEMTHRWTGAQDHGYPYLVAEIDGRIGGYAYAGLFRERPAYRYTVEDSVYVSPDFLGLGLGAGLLGELIDLCAGLGYRQMIAVIGDTANDQSINLHLRLGFEHAGVLGSTGFKHGRWVDSVMMQRALGPGDAQAPSE
ncbi:MAG: N-acetyltransferase [Rhodospirillaceae bacterium]|jgi:phosphinothricin acetyltransferase|nr:N-acetyltransferase [Rhodospirillaceae bacterium]MBT3884228.1 N-acetyltransferase [Rhodospirillaceae bacterium]MBT4118178.1 N-acetyltransferase [Rhodospirillaceae bacterium]MBT4674375.1 N-acetyltransferase [Rhodospirillaceae bacterium]MBT4721187.1 N-acetyltransferase [Rhodospirillaceae bacterium]